MADAVRAIGPARFGFVLAAWLFVVSVVVQTILVGLDIFADLGGSIHRDFAYVYGWLAPVLVLLAGLARAPKDLRWLSVVLLLLFAAQTGAAPDGRSRVSALRPDLPPAVDEVIARAMATDPAERFPTTGAVLDAAMEAVHRQRSSAGPSGRAGAALPRL